MSGAGLWCGWLLLGGCAGTTGNLEGASGAADSAFTAGTGPTPSAPLENAEGVSVDLGEIRFEALFHAAVRLQESLPPSDVRSIEALEAIETAEELYLDGRVELASTLLLEALITLRNQGHEE